MKNLVKSKTVSRETVIVLQYDSGSRNELTRKGKLTTIKRVEH